VFSTISRAMAGARQGAVGRHHLGDEAAGERFLRLEHSSRIAPGSALLDADGAAGTSSTRFRTMPRRKRRSRSARLRSRCEYHGELHGDADADGGPFTAAITGFRHSKISSVSLRRRRARARRSSRPCRPDRVALEGRSPRCVASNVARAGGRSAPAQKARPAGDDDAAHLVVLVAF